MDAQIDHETRCLEILVARRGLHGFGEDSWKGVMSVDLFEKAYNYHDAEELSISVSILIFASTKGRWTPRSL